MRTKKGNIDVPDGAGGVHGDCADDRGIDLIPVEGGNGRTVVGVLRRVEEPLELGVVVLVDAPETEVVPRGGQEVR